MIRVLTTVFVASLTAACASGTTAPLISGGTADAIGTLAPEGCDAALGELEISTNAICRGIDVVTGGGTGRPGSRLRYAETDQFDLDLNASMATSIDPILVLVDGGAIPLADVQAAARPHPNSKRIVFWLAKIRDTDGENIACAPADDRDFTAVLANLAVNLAFDRLEAWRTYRPAAEYNSILIVERDGAVGDLVVRRVEFHRRDSGRALECPEAAAGAESDGAG